jgi:DNA-binding transcriptional MerR regulator
MSSNLAIGDFARATQLSVKTLRHYHQLGLLVPADVNTGSGYRRYSIDQIPTAQVIRRFRDLDMPLERIGEVLVAPDLATRNELIADHLARLEHGLAETQAAVSSLRNLLEGPPASSRIEHRSEQAIASAAISEVVEVEHLSAWFQGALGEIYATLAAEGIATAGAAGSVVSNDFFAEERGEITIFVPASEPVRAIGRVASLVLSAVELATIVHRGSHVDIDRAYGSLAAYVSERALGVEGPIRERYLVGHHNSDNATEWRTEISWPIFHTAIRSSE